MGIDHKSRYGFCYASKILVECKLSETVPTKVALVSLSKYIDRSRISLFWNAKQVEQSPHVVVSRLVFRFFSLYKVCQVIKFYFEMLPHLYIYFDNWYFVDLESPTYTCTHHVQQ
jgi:hypothetical protein